MILLSSCSCFCPIHWSQLLSRQWRCSWGSADRWCSNYIWVISKFIAYQGASYIRDMTVLMIMRTGYILRVLHTISCLCYCSVIFHMLFFFVFFLWCSFCCIFMMEVCQFTLALHPPMNLLTPQNSNRVVSGGWGCGEWGCGDFS